MTTILIVDDEEGFRHILQVILQRAGYTTISVRDAFEAAHMVATKAIQLIILDDMMPGKSGSEWCMEMKSNEDTRHIPIIMHSANSKLHNKAYAQTIGAQSVLLKPCSPREIVAAVQQFAQVGV